jgi:hypothetical protein
LTYEPVVIVDVFQNLDRNDQVKRPVGNFRRREIFEDDVANVAAADTYTSDRRFAKAKMKLLLNSSRLRKVQDAHLCGNSNRHVRLATSDVEQLQPRRRITDPGPQFAPNDAVEGGRIGSSAKYAISNIVIFYTTIPGIERIARGIAVAADNAYTDPMPILLFHGKVTWTLPV